MHKLPYPAPRKFSHHTGNVESYQRDRANITIPLGDALMSWLKSKDEQVNKGEEGKEMREKKERIDRRGERRGKGKEEKRGEGRPIYTHNCNFVLFSFKGCSTSARLARHPPSFTVCVFLRSSFLLFSPLLFSSHLLFLFTGTTYTRFENNNQSLVLLSFPC